jgi:hypothetical protein
MSSVDTNVGLARGGAEDGASQAAAHGARVAAPAAVRTRSTKGLARAMRVGDADLLARRRAACVLEVLAGVRTPEECASALDVALGSFFQLEERALRGLVAGCMDQPRGRAPDLAKALEEARVRIGQLEREVQRHQALLRGAQRAAGLLGDARASASSPVRPPTPSKASSSRGAQRKIRALRAVDALRAPAPGSPAPGNPAPGNPSAQAVAGEVPGAER